MNFGNRFLKVLLFLVVFPVVLALPPLWFAMILYFYRKDDRRD